MRKTLATLILAVMLLFCSNGFAADTRTDFVRKVYNSVALLYGQTEDGGMRMRCTATAYRVLDKKAGYRFASASHCVDGDNDTKQKSGRYFITSDTEGSKTFIPARLVEAGDRNVGDDFSIFEVKTDLVIEVTPLGDSDKIVIGENVVNVASPLGLGKQFFQGYVSSTHLDRPPLDAGEVQWTNVMLVFIGGGPGSSGSAIVSEDQKAIVGFLVGSTGGANIGAICVPVNKFIAFEKAVDAGKYKKTRKEEDKLPF
jgi:hypothetical protein